MRVSTKNQHFYREGKHMAQVFNSNAVSRSVTLYSALPEEIIFKPELAGRKTYADADIASLAADIYKNGQNTAALCRKDDAGNPVLVFGRRRMLAVAYINKHLLANGDQKVKLQFKYESMSDQEALITAISENRFRKDVNDMDHCFNINHLLKRFKLSLAEVAAIYFPEAEDDKAKGDALRWVRERAGLAELAPEAAQAVRDGEIKITTAKGLAKLPKDDQRKVLASKTKVAGKARLKVDAVKAAKAAKTGKAPVKATPPPKPAPKVSATVYELAENMARALDVWRTDATEAAEKAVIAAHEAYRKAVPFRSAEGKAA